MFYWVMTKNISSTKQGAGSQYIIRVSGIGKLVLNESTGCFLFLKANSMFNFISLEWSFKYLKITMETEGRLND